jgi:hypothetical protein
MKGVQGQLAPVRGALPEDLLARWQRFGQAWGCLELVFVLLAQNSGS